MDSYTQEKKNKLLAFLDKNTQPTTSSSSSSSSSTSSDLTFTVSDGAMPEGFGSSLEEKELAGLKNYDSSSVTSETASSEEIEDERGQNQKLQLPPDDFIPFVEENSKTKNLELLPQVQEIDQEIEPESEIDPETYKKYIYKTDQQMLDLKDQLTKRLKTIQSWIDLPEEQKLLYIKPNDIERIPKSLNFNKRNSKHNRSNLKEPPSDIYEILNFSLEKTETKNIYSITFHLINKKFKNFRRNFLDDLENFYNLEKNPQNLVEPNLYDNFILIRRDDEGNKVTDNDNGKKMSPIFCRADRIDVNTYWLIDYCEEICEKIDLDGKPTKAKLLPKHKEKLCTSQHLMLNNYFEIEDKNLALAKQHIKDIIQDIQGYTCSLEDDAENDEKSDENPYDTQIQTQNREFGVKVQVEDDSEENGYYSIGQILLKNDIEISCSFNLNLITRLEKIVKTSKNSSRSNSFSEKHNQDKFKWINFGENLVISNQYQEDPEIIDMNENVFLEDFDEDISFECDKVMTSKTTDVKVVKEPKIVEILDPEPEPQPKTPPKKPKKFSPNKSNILISKEMDNLEWETNRNYVISHDPTDPSFLFQNYSNKQDKFICKYYNQPGGCFKGRNCDKKHIKISSGAGNSGNGNSFDGENGDNANTHQIITPEIINPKKYFNYDKYYSLRNSNLQKYRKMYILISHITSPSKFHFYGFMVTEDLTQYEKDPQVIKNHYWDKIEKMSRRLKKYFHGGDDFMYRSGAVAKKHDYLIRKRLIERDEIHEPKELELVAVRLGDGNWRRVLSIRSYYLFY